MDYFKFIILLIIASIGFYVFFILKNKSIKGNGNIISKSFNTNSYDKIKIEGSLNVEFVKGNQGDLFVKTDENLLEHLIVEVKNDILHLRIKNGFKLISKNGILITVPFEEIYEVKLSGSGNIETRDLIKTDNLSVVINGSGEISLNVESENIIAEINGSGNIVIEGETTYLDASIAGSGDFDGLKLNSLITKINILGSGNAKVVSKKEITIKITGSGDVFYKGNPNKKVEIIGSGDVSKL